MATDQYSELLHLHRELDTASRLADGRAFLSGWQTVHPYADSYLPRDGKRAVPVQRYAFLSDSEQIQHAIRKFHLDKDGVDYPKERLYISSGSSPLLMAYFLRLREKGIDEAFFVPPLYYTCFYFANSLGIRLRPAGRSPLHDPESRLELPERRTVLLFSDPVWIFGTRVHKDVIQAVQQWQLRTGSEVLVDGTFQYTPWGDDRTGEETAHLEDELTYRIVCPTKSTAVHGSRFAYMLLPPGQREFIRYPATNLTGANGTEAEADAVRLMEVLNARTGNGDLCAHIRCVHERLVGNGVIVEEAARPTVSYYTFARVNVFLSAGALLMDQRYFGLSGYPGFVRVNLLCDRFAGEGSRGDFG
jgi:hypothetical protein